MINWKSILSSFNNKPTLLQWLKLVEKALKESVLKSVTTEQDADKANTKLIFNFEDGTQIETGFFPTKGKDAAEIMSATSMYVGTTNGLSKSRVTFSKSDNRSFYADILAKAGKAVESFSSAVKEVTDENTVNTITVNYDDKTSNTFEISSARGKQGATGATGATGAEGPAGPKGAEGPAGPKGADGVSITGIDTVSNEVVGDKTLTTLRAHYSNDTTNEFVVAAQNGISGKLYIHRVSLKSSLFTSNEYYITVPSSDSTPITAETANRLLYGFVETIDGSDGAYQSCTVKDVTTYPDNNEISIDGTLRAVGFLAAIESDTVLER